MADEKEKKPSAAKKPKKKGNSKIDMPTIIFFAVMVVGLIVLTIILLTKPSSKIYEGTYGDFVVMAEVYSNNKIDLAVDINQERVLQSGTYKEITDDDVENNYEAEFKSDEDESVTKVTFVIDKDKFTMTYDDGTTVELKETSKK